MHPYLERRDVASCAPPALALGTMNFGKRTPEDEARRIMSRAAELDVRWFDTANVYGDGASERIVGRAVRGLGLEGKVGVATKVGLLRLKGRPEGLSPVRMLRALDESLDRLGLPAIDLWYLHAPDPQVPLDESIGAMAEAVQSGRVRAWGMSNFASWEVLEATNLARARDLVAPKVAQQLYNLLVRQLDVEWFKFARRHSIHTTVYNPLAGGLLSGRHREGDRPAKGTRFDGNRLYLDRYWTARSFEVARAYAEQAQGAGLRLPELALAWLGSVAGVDSILLGPGSLEHLEQGVAACRTPLSPDLLREVDRAHLAAQGTDARYAR
jgi:aryl-alcohol dehydrogenase-like predicted oxidoreductase